MNNAYLSFAANHIGYYELLFHNRIVLHLRLRINSRSTHRPTCRSGREALLRSDRGSNVETSSNGLCISQFRCHQK